MANAVMAVHIGLPNQMPITAAKPPKEWMPRDAKDRFYDKELGGLRSYLPGEASFLEVLTSRIYFTLNGCLYEEGDNWIITLLRPIGWGARMALFLFSFIFIGLSLTRSVNPIGQYTLSRERDADGVLTNSDADTFEWFVYLTFFVWVLSILTSTLTYLGGRYGAKQPYSTQLCASFPFIFCNRTAIHDNGDGTRCGLMLILTAWFLTCAAATSAVAYTVISHTFVKRNVYFAWLLVAMLAMMTFASIADSLSIGGSNGIYVQSRVASWLVALNAIVIVPLQIIVTVFFVWMANPPWDSI